MAQLNQYIRRNLRQPADVGFFYEGQPEAGVCIGAFTYRFNVIINITQCNIKCDTPTSIPAQLYMTVDNTVIANGWFQGGATPDSLVGTYQATSATTLTVASGQTVRLIAPDPTDTTLFNIRSTIAATRIITDGIE